MSFTIRWRTLKKDFSINVTPKWVSLRGIFRILVSFGILVTHYFVRIIFVAVGGQSCIYSGAAGLKSQSYSKILFKKIYYFTF